MLRLNKKANLETLVNYGFKPKYDEDTGKVVAYEKTVKEKEYIGLKIKLKKTKTVLRIFKFKEEWRINQYKDVIDIDTLYDLIQAGFVEKC